MGKNFWIYSSIEIDTYDEYKDIYIYRYVIK